MELKPILEQRPIRSMTDERLDFDDAAPLRKSYLVASSYRCGSTYFCWLLWKTGVLGAPSEVLNSATNELRTMMARFKAYSPAEYITELLAHRTSKNGVFGMKVHFPHFEAFLKQYPELPEALSPMTYIYIHREDKVAQAVSMAKALQTNQWSSRWEDGSRPPLRYDRELIAKSMKELELQDAGWLQWFETEGIEPFRVTYENLTADPDGTVASVVELLGVQNDEPSEVRVPPADKQGDDTNQEWIERYKQETRASGASAPADDSATGPVAAAEALSESSGGRTHFFDRSERLIASLPNMRDSPTGFVGLLRLRRRYDAIIAQNRTLLQDARVLDIGPYNGFWSLAALDAGAAHVVGLEATRKAAEAGEKNFREHGVRRESYRFIDGKISTALQSLNPDQFDVILCKGYFEHCHFTEFFNQLSRLRPKHVILDTKIAAGAGPLARFAISGKAWKGSGAKITATPNHDLITFLCEPEFRWRLIDWTAVCAADWAGVPDYARDGRRTYVLDRQS